MYDPQNQRTRLYFTAAVALAELGHLAWEHAHGGIKSHHLLNNPDLPAISNAWGALLLPVLAWFVSGRALRTAPGARIPLNVASGFLGSLLYGALLSTAFATGHESVASFLFLGMLLCAVVLPVYRGEYVLGFVLGMTFTIGAVLPTVVGSVVAAVSAGFHRLLRPAFGWVVARARG